MGMRPLLTWLLLLVLIRPEKTHNSHRGRSVMRQFFHTLTRSPQAVLSRRSARLLVGCGFEAGAGFRSVPAAVSPQGAGARHAAASERTCSTGCSPSTALPAAGSRRCTAGRCRASCNGMSPGLTPGDASGATVCCSGGCSCASCCTAAPASGAPRAEARQCSTASCTAASAPLPAAASAASTPGSTCRWIPRIGELARVGQVLVLHDWYVTDALNSTACR